ncbi:DUF3288 family protein [Argonema galeatum]|uniref:DUF3288 family protein n=1 Tax=Argonema galeatum TaxID=2942762 RepID=UPI0020130DF9|nr:DUF3288 family protein [Argonema galeatum]MCL1467361.1 DUF3288 family protein [Argonema galeatum A003/A1]
MTKEQQHPQYWADRKIVDNLLSGQPNDYKQAELARLKIRYRGFPGAPDIQKDLEKVLQKWDMSEEQLYEITRKIHEKGQVYKTRNSDTEDWA